MKRFIQPLSIATLSLVLAACGTMSSMPQVPAAIAAPAGKAAMTLQGVGLLTYECRAKAENFEWTFAGPSAELRDRSGTVVGKYYGGPTWEHSDGSKVTGKQL